MLQGYFPSETPGSNHDDRISFYLKKIRNDPSKKVKAQKAGRKDHKKFKVVDDGSKTYRLAERLCELFFNIFLPIANCIEKTKIKEKRRVMAYF